MNKKANFKWLAQRREEVGISQEEFASRLQLDGFNITRAAVANWEQGRNNPKTDNLLLMESIGKALRLSVRDILQLSGYEISESHSNAGQRAAYIVDRLKERDQKLALEILERFLEREI